MKTDCVSSVLKRFTGILCKSLAASPLAVERAERKLYVDYLQEGMVVFDVGVHVGELTLLFSKLVGQQGQVHAFEPSRETFRCLGKVRESANRKNVTFNHKAVSNSEGTVTLHVYDSKHSAWKALAERPLHNYGIDVEPNHVEVIDSVTIDGYWKETDIANIDLVKIDAEGAEC